MTRLTFQFSRVVPQFLHMFHWQRFTCITNHCNLSILNIVLPWILHSHSTFLALFAWYMGFTFRELLLQASVLLWFSYYLSLGRGRNLDVWGKMWLCSIGCSSKQSNLFQAFFLVFWFLTLKVFKEWQWAGSLSNLSACNCWINNLLFCFTPGYVFFFSPFQSEMER